MEKVSTTHDGQVAVMVLDEPGNGNACHEYQVIPAGMIDVDDDDTSFAQVSFQNGPIQENGINGCHQEDLLEIVRHRLQSFQAGEFACHENQMALDKVEEALHWLDHQTAARRKRGVEGKSIV